MCSHRFELLGIHESTTACMPVFAIYLATLFHTFGLLSRRSAAQRVLARDSEMSAEEGLSGSQTEMTQKSSAPSWISRISRFFARAFGEHEGPPSFLIVKFHLKEAKNSMVDADLGYFLESYIQTGLANSACLGGGPDGPTTRVSFYSFIDGNGDAGENTVKAMFQVFSSPNTPISIELKPAGSVKREYLCNRLCCNASGDPSNLVEVLSMESHSRANQDWYALIAALDIMAFTFVALYYNRMVKASGSIQEITSQHVVPLGYLVTLIVLFLLLVLDRVTYTIGSQAGKATLHVGQVNFPCCIRLLAQGV